MSACPKELTSTQLVFDAARELHAQNQKVTRESLREATGLPLHIVDERLRVLTNRDEKLVRLQRGQYKPAEVFHDTRAMSKTILQSGAVKYDIGDDVIELSQHEDRVLFSLVTGSTGSPTLLELEARLQAKNLHDLHGLHEPRSMSRTAQPNGLMRYEIGDLVLLLSPQEDRTLCLLVAGAASQIATIEAIRHSRAAHEQISARLERIEKTQRDRARRAGPKAA